MVLLSQNNDGTVDTSHYYIRFYDKLQVYLLGVSKINSFSLKESSNSNTAFVFSPNESINLGLGFNYKWVGIGAAFNYAFLNSDDDKYGKTSNTDLRLDIYGRKWYWNIVSSRYSGYYWKNPDLIYSNWNSKDSVLIRPDISTYHLSLNTVYAFNHEKFSLKSAFVSNEWQQRNAGSVLLGWHGSIYGLDVDSTLVTAVAMNEYPNASSIVDMVSINMGAALGYTYTFVFNKYMYLNLALMGGLSMQSVVISMSQPLESDREMSLSLKWHGRLAIGYQNEKNFTGIGLLVDNYQVNTPTASVFSYTFGKIRFFYGRRFAVHK